MHVSDVDCCSSWSRLVNRTSAHRAALVDRQPLIDTFSVELVVARQNAQSLLRLVVGTANGTSSNRTIKPLASSSVAAAAALPPRELQLIHVLCVCLALGCINRASRQRVDLRIKQSLGT